MTEPSLGFVPAVVAPIVLVLISPMPLLAAVETGELGQDACRMRRGAKVVGFLGIEVVHAIAVHMMTGVLPVRGNQRRGAVDELLRLVSVLQQFRGVVRVVMPQAEQELHHVAALRRRHRGHQPVGHQRSDRLALDDLVDRDR